MDTLTKKQRSWNMSRIKSRNTQPEKIVRKFISKRGIKYRLHVKKLPGKPDIAIDRKKKVIFINGCFWHQHKGCKRRAMPKTNIKYWLPKLKRNAEKQKQDIKQLEKKDWKAYIIWECEAKNKNRLIKKLRKIL